MILTLILSLHVPWHGPYCRMILTLIRSLPSYDSYPDMIRTTLTLSLPSYDSHPEWFVLPWHYPYRRMMLNLTWFVLSWHYPYRHLMLTVVWFLPWYDWSYPDYPDMILTILPPSYDSLAFLPFYTSLLYVSYPDMILTVVWFLLPCHDSYYSDMILTRNMILTLLWSLQPHDSYSIWFYYPHVLNLALTIFV